MDSIRFEEAKKLDCNDFMQFAPEIFQVTHKDSIQINRCDLNSLPAIHVIRKSFGFAKGSGRLAAQVCLDSDISIQDAVWLVIDVNVHKHIQGGFSEIIAAQEYLEAYVGDETTVLTGFRSDCAQQEGVEITVIMGATKMIGD